MSRCCVCGQTMIDDIEVGQGYCITAPCWMYATGQRELALEWLEENPGFWEQLDVQHSIKYLCEYCGMELDDPNETCLYCIDEGDSW